MTNNIELIEATEQPVLSIRKTTSMANLQQELGNAFMAVMQHLGALGEEPAGPVFAAYYNMDMQALDVEMGVLVTKPVAGKGEIQSGTVPAGKQVSCIHKGAYTQMEPVYKAMNDWMTAKGLVPTGVVYEFYMNSPMEVPESELLTKVVFPVK